ncbi:MAG: hypothetical protein V1781_00290 [Bacteroidota bacterium]
MRIFKCNKIVLYVSTFSLVLFFTFYSCRRNKDCTVVVRVMDISTEGPILGANVSIHPTTQSKPTMKGQTGITDAAGSASFVFKLPAILQVDVTASGHTAGTALVKLEEGKTVSKTIKLQ